MQHHNPGKRSSAGTNGRFVPIEKHYSQPGPTRPALPFSFVILQTIANSPCWFLVLQTIAYPPFWFLVLQTSPTRPPGPFGQVKGRGCFGPNFPDLYLRVAGFVDKILCETKPADIPAEPLARFDLIVNLTTARAPGLTIPETFLVQANQLIE